MKVEQEDAYARKRAIVVSSTTHVNSGFEHVEIRCHECMQDRMRERWK